MSVIVLARRRPGIILLALALVAAAAFGGTRILDEGAVSTHGDMPRHMMNGVFLADLTASGAWTPTGVLSYAQLYYARYPALSLGHAPPLLPASMVPFYAVFGVSVSSARLCVLSWFLLTVVLTFVVARRWVDEVSGGWASLLLATHPYFVKFGQEVMTEAPAVALVLAALAVLLRFCESGRTRHFGWFVVLASASLAARQTAIFAFPLYAVLLASRISLPRLLARGVLIWTGIGVIVTGVVVAGTLALSPYNVGLVQHVIETGAGADTVSEVFAALRFQHLEPALWVGVPVAVLAAIWRRSWRTLAPMGWALWIVGCVVLSTGTQEFGRYAILALPAFCIQTGALPALLAPGWKRAVASAFAGALLIAQLSSVRSVTPAGAAGYEAAAKVVASDASASTVLYSAPVDTGYFIFFVRKHDATGKLVVLRDDKLFTTSFMGVSDSETLVTNEAEMLDTLQRYGTKYVVIEESQTGSESSRRLGALMHTERFRERARFTIDSRDDRIRQRPLVVYEQIDVPQPDLSTKLELRIPLVGKTVSASLGDLLGSRR